MVRAADFGLVRKSRDIIAREKEQGWRRGTCDSFLGDHIANLSNDGRVDDATGYSKEEEEATSVSCEEFL